MADILSLSRARKAKTAAGERASAAANRLKHGRTKAESAQQAAERTRQQTRLSQARRAPASDR